MFARGISILISSAVDAGNIPAPRPSDALAERCAQDAMRALQADAQFMTLSQRREDPERYHRIQKKRRAQLESFLWIEPNQDALECMLDLIVLICEENSWSAGSLFDDPAHPDIDLQAAETGTLFAWLLRKHGARLDETSPRIRSLMMGELRRRLLVPVSAHEDYPFMSGRGRCPGLVMCDLLLSCVLTEKSSARRQQPVKVLLRLMDRLCAGQSDPCQPLEDRVSDACAIADFARLMKRLTRGEFDLTRSMPPEGWLDDVLIPWVQDNYFIDPAGEGPKPEIAGMDLFRLGYLTQDRALCALGAQLHQMHERPGASLSGRILSMEYMRAARDECSPAPRLKRASAENGSVMLSRVDQLFCAICGVGTRANTGDISIFADGLPVLSDAGGAVHSLPVINGCLPLMKMQHMPHTKADFGADRDLMTVDLTEAYPERSMLTAYQRTLVTLRGDGTVRLVDAFEFYRIPEKLTFRFVAVQRPVPLRDGVRIGPVDLSWDGEMQMEISELPACEDFPGGCWLINLTPTEIPGRMLCGFTFEKN